MLKVKTNIGTPNSLWTQTYVEIYLYLINQAGGECGDESTRWWNSLVNARRSQS